MSVLTFSFLSEAHIDQVIELRKEVYLKYYGNSVDLSGLNWNNMDRMSTHLGIFRQDQLVSYLRLSYFNELRKLEDATQIPTPAQFACPVALLARAATQQSFLGQGLHSVLRAISLELCLKHGMTTIFGSLEEKSLRTAQLLEVGYEVVARAEKWKNSYITNSGDVLLIALQGREKIQNAIQQLRRRNESFDYNYNLPEELRFV